MTALTQPTGSNIVRWQDIDSTAKFSSRINSVGTGNLVSFDSGTFHFTNFGDGTQTIKWGNAAYGALLTNKGLLGSGRDYTFLSMRDSTSNKAGDVPPNSTATGGAASPTNNLQLIQIGNPNGGVRIENLTVLGTPQGHKYNGLRLQSCISPIVRNVTVKAVPGDSGTPPGETFHLNFQRTSGTATVVNLTIDGAGIGAAGAASNSASATFNVTGLRTKGCRYSAGWASWQQSGNMTFTNWVATGCARHFNAERLSGHVTFVNPVWNEPFSGKHDINYTWDSTFVNGSITFKFTTTTAWSNFIAARATKKIKIVTNPHGKGNIRGSVHIYVAGVLKTTSNYVLWDGTNT